MQTVGANLAYRYDPLIDKIREINRFGWLPQLEDSLILLIIFQKI